MAEEEASKEAEAAEEGEEESSSSGGGSKLILILTGVNLLISLGVGAFIFISFQKEKQKSQAEDIVAEEAHAPEGADAKKDGHGGGEAVGGHGAAGDKAAAPGGHDFGKMIALDQFTVNLSTQGTVSPKFARVNISLEVPGDDTEVEVNQKMPQVRNTIIDLFNSKRPTDLSTPEGRVNLRDEIRNTINSFLVTGEIKGVYFTGFALSS